jgi:3-oxosteroid 1-dehydrogenase
MQHGARITRPIPRPDYYDERPGSCPEGRTVSPMLFDANKLGEWRHKLRPGFMPAPVMVSEGRRIAMRKVAWDGKLIFAKVALRVVVAKLLGRQLVSAGEALQGQMLLAASSAGVEFRTDSPVSELIVEEGAVRGVVTLRDGRPWRIGARLGVLINAGGFAKNQRMRDEHQPGTRTEWSAAIYADTGEMIEEMMRHGARRADGRDDRPSTHLYAGTRRPAALDLSAKHHGLAACDLGRPERPEVPERGRLLRALLQADVCAEQDAAGRSELGDLRFPVHGQIHAVRRPPRQAEACTVV